MNAWGYPATVKEEIEMAEKTTTIQLSSQEVVAWRDLAATCGISIRSEMMSRASFRRNAASSCSTVRILLASQI